MKARVLALVVAGVVALFGVGAVVLYAQGADSRAVAGAMPQPVYVSQKLVPAGTVLGDAVTSGLLTRTNIAAGSKPAGSLADVTADNQQLVAVTDIQPGEYVLAARFGSQSSGTKALQVPNGQVAVAAQLSDPARVGASMTPGSRIVIFDTHEVAASADGKQPGGTQTQVLLQDVLVIAVGNTSLTPVASGSAPDAAAAASVLLTVALPPEDATRLVHGIQTGRLYAGLRGTDVKVDLAGSVSDASLFAK